MVKIAIAGGSASRLYYVLMLNIKYDRANSPIDVAMEVIDALVATKKHEILLLSRKVLLCQFYLKLFDSRNYITRTFPPRTLGRA